MQRPTPTARRFYTAFYRWSLLTSSLPSRNVHTHLHHRPRENRLPISSQRSRVLARRQFSNGAPHHKDLRPNINYAQPQAAQQSQAWATWLRETAVQPSAEQPFDTLDVWQDVVRYRSGAGVMVQTAVPVKRLREMERKKFGEGLKQLTDQLFGSNYAGGARVEVGMDDVEKAMIGGYPEIVRSVLYSGTLEEVEKIRMAFGGVDEGRGYEEGVPRRGAQGSKLIRTHRAMREIQRVPSQGQRQRDMRRGEHDAVVRKETFGSAGEGYKRVETTPQILENANDSDTAIRQTTPATTQMQTPPQSAAAFADLLKTTPTDHDVLPTRNIRPFSFVLRSYDTGKDQLHISSTVPTAAYDEGDNTRLHARLFNKFVGGQNAKVGAKLKSTGKYPSKDPQWGEVKVVEMGGSVEQVEKIWEGILKVEQRMRTDSGGVESVRRDEDVGRASDREVREKERQQLSSRRRSSLTRLPPPPPPPQLAPVNDTYKPLPSWLLTPPKSRTEMPSAGLILLQPVLRDRSQDSRVLHVEVVVPANEKWDQEIMILMQQPRDANVSIDLETPFSRMDENTGESHWKRPLMLKGGSKEILGVVEMVEEMRRKVLGLSSVQDAFLPLSDIEPSPSPSVAPSAYTAAAKTASTATHSHQRTFYAQIAIPETVTNAVRGSLRNKGVQIFEVEKRNLFTISLAPDEKVFELRGDLLGILKKSLGAVEKAAGASLAKKGTVGFSDVVRSGESMEAKWDRSRSGRGAIKILELGLDDAHGRHVSKRLGGNVGFGSASGGPKEVEQAKVVAEESQPEFFARIAVPDSAAYAVGQRIAGLIRSGSLAGCSFNVAEKRSNNDATESTETVLLFQATTSSTLHLAIKDAGLFALDALGMERYSFEADAGPEREGIGRILEMGTRDDQGVYVPDAGAAWYGYHMSRTFLDRFSVYNRLAYPASVAKRVISLCSTMEKSMGSNVCRIQAEKDPEHECDERFLEVWASNTRALHQVRYLIKKTVRRSAKKYGLAGADDFGIRIVDKEGNEILTPRAESNTAVDSMENDAEVDHAHRFDELYRRSVAEFESDKEAAEEAVDNVKDDPTQEAADSTAEFDSQFAESVFSPVEREPSGGADISPAAADTLEHDSDRPLTFETKITMPARHAEYVIPKIPEIIVKVGDREFSISDASLFKIELIPRPTMPDHKSFRISAASEGILQRSRRALARVARESFVQAGVEYDDASLMHLRAGTEWVLDVKSSMPTITEYGASRILPIYRRVAVPVLAADFLQRNLGDLRGATDCAASSTLETVEDGDLQGARRIFVLWGSTEDALDKAVDHTQKLALRAFEINNQNIDPESIVQVLEQGMDEEGWSRMHRDYILPKAEQRYAGTSEFRAFSTFTLPRVALKDVDASLQEMVYVTRCQLLQIKPPEVYIDDQQDTQDRRVFTLWGQAESQVQRAKQMIEVASQESLDAQDSGEVALTVLQEGMSGATLLDAMETARRLERKKVPRQASTEHGNHELFVDKTPTSTNLSELSTLDTQSFFENAEDSGELDVDNLLFPEFSLPPADDTRSNSAFGRPSFADILPAVNTNFKSVRKPLQQRAYSTVPSPPRAAPAAETSSAQSNVAEDTAEDAEDTEAQKLSSRKEELIENVKLTLRTFTHPVVVVTSRFHGRNEGDSLDICRGVTVSSFNTVTLSPVPIVSLNLRVPSRSWDAIRQSGKLGINVPSATPEGAAIAHAFTQPYEQPSEPFMRLRKFGIDVFVNKPFAKGNHPPFFIAGEAIIGHIWANLLEDKCILIGDHVVVVAEVKKVQLRTINGGSTRVADKHLALAYAQKEYRGIGDGIIPVALPDLKASGVEPNTALSQAATSEFPTRGPDERIDMQTQPDETNEDTARAFDRAAKITTRERETKTRPDEYNHARTRRLKLQEDDYERTSSGSNETPQSAPIEKYFELLETDASKEESTARSSQPVTQQTYSYTAPPALPRTGPVSGYRRPSGISQVTKSSYSTSSAQMTRFRGTVRLYSHSSAELEGNRSSNSDSKPMAQVSDLKLLSTSVASFLGVPENANEHIPSKHIHGLMRLQREARTASRRLERALANGSLTPEESARLENVILTNERRITKVLALRSARDLRRALDKGRVDYKQVQWLETNIEKGQAVLLEEAKQLRRMFDDKAIADEQFQMARQKLEQQNQVLTAEATRLRQMVDEDSEGGGTASRDFDGFRGNL